MKKVIALILLIMSVISSFTMALAATENNLESAKITSSNQAQAKISPKALKL